MIDGDGKEMGIDSVYVCDGVRWVGVSGDDVVSENVSEIDSVSFCSLLVIYFAYGREEHETTMWNSN